MFTAELLTASHTLLTSFRNNGKMIVTAESCTGGLLAALLTEHAGSSDVFERGYVTYSNAAKIASLSVPTELINRYGAVSEHVAIAMAQGALAHSNAHVSLAITGIAGPDGGSAQKPVGLVHFATGWRTQTELTQTATNQAHTRQGILHHKAMFGPLPRSAIRAAALQQALILLENSLNQC
jgi:nicotinamide-nucleotide amidase